MVCHQQLNAMLNTISIVFIKVNWSVPPAPVSDHVWVIVVDKVTSNSVRSQSTSSEKSGPQRPCLSPADKLTFHNCQCQRLNLTVSMNHWIVPRQALLVYILQKYNPVYHSSCLMLYCEGGKMWMLILQLFSHISASYNTITFLINLNFVKLMQSDKIE